ncbi:MAG: PD-(D/E)XK nuclease family transposase [Saprospiraceae bacterium]
MALQDKYINPFTDYGFQKLFEAAEIARFDPAEKAKYEESLKYYRDLKNVVDTSFEEGKEEGRAEKEIEMILKSHDAGVLTETISRITGKSIEEIEKIIKEAGR